MIFGRNKNIKLLKNGNTPTLRVCNMEMYHQEQTNTHNWNLPSTTKWVHNTTNGMFIDDITELLVNKLPQYENRVILGDFNIHTEDLTNADAIIFNDTMRVLGLEQHISGPTHVRGNTLALIFTQLSNGFNIQYHITMDTSQITVWSQSTST